MDRRFSREIARLEVGGPFRKRNVGGGSRIGDFGGGGGPAGPKKNLQIWNLQRLVSLCFDNSTNNTSD